MRILCFGDSNTYGYDPRSYFGGRYPAEHRWVDLLAQKTGHEVLNAGANGREIPKRSTEAYGLDVTVDLLVIMLGSNDLLQGNDVTTVVSRMEVFLTQLSSERERIIPLSLREVDSSETKTEGVRNSTTGAIHDTINSCRSQFI